MQGPEDDAGLAGKVFLALDQWRRRHRPMGIGNVPGSREFICLGARRLAVKILVAEIAGIGTRPSAPSR